MPIWVIILLISLCITTVTGIYTLRQNGRNGYRNGSGNGHTISQMTHSSEQSLSGEPPSQEKKTLTLSVPKVTIVEEESPHETVTKWNQSKNNGALPDEEPHDHSEDHSPDPVLRERRRMLVRPREDEEESGNDELHEPELSVAPETLPAPIEDQRKLNKVRTIETGTQEKWQHDEDVIDTLIVKKDAETQTTIFQSDKNVEARPEMRDEEAQSSPVKESLTTQTILPTEEKSVGEALETKNRAVQVSPDQEDKSLQESPDHHSIGVGTNEKEMRDQSLQIFPSLQDKDIQKDISRVSMGIQNVNVLAEDKSVQAEEERISISLSSLPKLKPFFFSSEEKFDLSKSFSLSLSSQHPQNLLDEIQTIKSEILLSPKSNSLKLEESEIEESFFYPILQKKKSFHIEDIPLEVSIYPSLNQSLVESEVIESKILEKSRSLSLKKSAFHQDIENMSFELLDNSPKSVQKKPLDDLSFEILEKASRKSSFSIIQSDEEM